MTTDAFASGNWVEDLPWPAVEQRLVAGAVALLPIGAASKEHGPHLPHGTDYFQARYFAERVAVEIDALIWPVVHYGYYPVFTEYPGSVSLQSETFFAMTSEILNAIDAAGASATVLLNTGISTIEVLTAMLRERTGPMPVALVNCYAGDRFMAAVGDVETQLFGGHADEIETALMLAIDPAKVSLERAVASAQPIERGRFNRHNADAPNYSPSGVNGDPTVATVAKGERLLEALISDIVAAVSAVPRR